MPADWAFLVLNGIDYGLAHWSGYAPIADEAEEPCCAGGGATCNHDEDE